MMTFFEQQALELPYPVAAQEQLWTCETQKFQNLCPEPKCDRLAVDNIAVELSRLVLHLHVAPSEQVFLNHSV